MISFPKFNVRTIRLSIIMLLINPWCQAQTFHAILVADTRDPSLGASCEKDLQEMSGTLRHISKKIEYNYQEIICKQDQFGKRGILEAVSKIQCKPEDVIFFYYSGHGINAEKSKFPILYLKDENLELETVHRLLKEKKPRFCLTLGDCCNKLLAATRPPKSKPVVRGIRVTEDTKTARALFLDANGDLLISSAMKGEQATAHPRDGSFYSSIWMQALAYAEGNNEHVSWEALLTDAENRLQASLKSLPDSLKHHSQWVSTLPAAPLARTQASLAETNKFMNLLAEQRINDLQLYIALIADKNNSAEQREQAVELAVGLFEKDHLVNGKRRSPHVQVCRPNGAISSVPVQIYFKNLMHVKFDKVEITSYDASVVSKFEKAADGDYRAIATYYRQFKGMNEQGELVYGSRDRRDIRLAAQSAAVYAQAGKEDPKIFLGDITVKDTVPIPGF